MVIIGAGFDSNYMIAAQYTQPRLCVCVCGGECVTLRRNLHKIAAQLLNRLFAAVACFTLFLCVYVQVHVGVCQI